MNIMTFIFILFVGAFFSSFTHAAPAGLTYQGRLVKNNLPVESPSVQLTLKVTSPGVNECVLFEETHTLNMTNSDGIFSVKIGGGTRTVNDKGFSLIQVFSNSGSAISSLVCSGGATSYTSTSTDSRNIYAGINDGIDAVAFSSPYTIQSVPYALEAERLAGKTPADFLQVTSDTTQPKINDLMVPATYSELFNILGGTSSQYMTSSSTNGTTIPVLSSQPGTLSAGKMWYEAGALKYYDGVSSSVKTLGTSGGSVTSVSSANAYLSVATGTSTPALTLNVGTTANTVAAGDDSRITGALQTGATIGGSTAISTTGNIQTSGSVTTRNLYFYDNAGAGPGSVGFRAPATVTNYVMTLPAAVASGNNYVLASDTSGVLSWIAPSTGSVTSITGTAPVTITGTAAVPIVNVSAATTGASGIVTLAASGGTTASTVVQATDARLSDARAPNGTAAGDLSGTYPNPAVAKLQGTAVSSTTPTSSGQMLRFNGTNWTPNFVSMTDLRSSITGTNQFASSCTSGQTLTYSSVGDIMSCLDISVGASNFSSQTANTFLAAPNGSAGTPIFRGLASADLPSGIATTGTYKSVTVDTYGRVTAGTNPTTLAGYGITDSVINGGQTGAVTVGTSDANSLTLNTNNTAKMTILSSGNVGIGTTNPSARLDVNGARQATAAPIQQTVSNGAVTIDFTHATGGYVPGLSWFATDNYDTKPRAGIWMLSGGSTSEMYLGTSDNFGAGITNSAVTIRGSGNVKFSGNIGVGTDPAAKSDVLVATQAAATSIQQTTANGAYVVSSTGDGYIPGLSWYNNNNYTTLPRAAIWTRESGGSSYMNFGTTSDPSVGVNNTAMTIAPSGNVGIGTTAPGATLDVNSSGLIGIQTTMSNTSNNAYSVNFNRTATTVQNSFNWSTNGNPKWNIGQDNDGTEHLYFYDWVSNRFFMKFFSGSGDIGIGNNYQSLYVNYSGNVGIGTTGPSYKLDVAGDINTSTCFRIGASVVSGTCTSDERLKENVQDYDAGLSDLLKIKLHTYTFNGLGEMPKTGEVAIGVIAQELEKTNPELVKTRMVKMHPEDAEKTEIKVVDYSKFSYMLINAVKELYHQITAKADKSEVEQLRAETNQLKSENAELKARMDKLEKAIISK